MIFEVDWEEGEVLGTPKRNITSLNLNTILLFMSVFCVLTLFIFPVQMNADIWKVLTTIENNGLENCNKWVSNTISTSLTESLWVFLMKRTGL